MKGIVPQKGWALEESLEARRVDNAAAAERAGRLIGNWLPRGSIEDWCRALEYGWRERVWGPAVTLWACVMKHLQGSCGARSMEDWLGSMKDGRASTADGYDFCQASARLPGANGPWSSRKGNR